MVEINGQTLATKLYWLNKYKKENETLREMLAEREQFIQKLYDANLNLAYKVQDILHAVDSWN